MRHNRASCQRIAPATTIGIAVPVYSSPQLIPPHLTTPPTKRLLTVRVAPLSNCLLICLWISILRLDLLIYSSTPKAFSCFGFFRWLFGLAPLNAGAAVRVGFVVAMCMEESSKKPNYLAIKVLFQGGQIETVVMEVAPIRVPNWIFMSRN
ncbi:hypothetical protein Nepgr_023528 [Nepenthes gracilis]|uniref:Uncharacterized protein n=1 Tax=Nepenthes gracilis TaxID=150966 RepID=A0AAD3T311_NEPGR|nr:hypothetical protein Nepgr_023528 [Nepenthes gracilis]